MGPRKAASAAVQDVFSVQLQPRHPAARFLFHAFRFLRTNRIDTQGMKKNKPTAKLEPTTR